MYLQQDQPQFLVPVLLSLSVDHPLSEKFNQKKDFQNFKSECDKTGTTEEALANAEKIGYKTSMDVDHPFIKSKKMPIYFANFVLMDYGTGAIFGCPAHDQRDFDFAKKYDLEITRVVSDKKKIRVSELAEAYSGPGKMINSEFLNDLNIEAAKEKIINEIEKKKLEREKLYLD